MVDAAELSFHFSIGVAAFFSPCGFPMLPAYLAYYLPAAEETPRGLRSALARGLGAGALVALGAFALLLAVGALAVWIGAPFKERVVHIELLGGLLVAGLGIATLLGRGPSLKVPLSPSRARNAFALVAFGALYAGVAASCVAPLLIYVLFRAFAATTVVDGFLLVGAYAAGLATLLLAATLLVATAQNALLARMKRVLPYVERASGVVLIVVGAYLVLYWASLQYGFYVPSLPTPTF